MTSAPLVSIITPCHYSKDDVRLAAESVVKQTHRPVEIVIVTDDGADYRETLAEVAAQVPVIFGSTGGVSTGPSNAVNKGLELCRGDLVLILDSDDFIDPDYLERAAGRAMAEGACLTPRRPVEYETGQPFEPRGSRFIAEYRDRKELTTREFLRLRFGWQTLYRRDLLVEPIEREFFLDQYMICEARVFDRIGHAPYENFQGYNYRVRSGSICHSDSSYKLAIREYRRMLERLNDERDGLGLKEATRRNLIDVMEDRLANIGHYIMDKEMNRLQYEPQVIGDIVMYPL